MGVLNSTDIEHLTLPANPLSENTRKERHTVISFRISSGVASLVLLVNIQLASVMHANLVGIEYWDKGFANPETNGGPMWEGFVDTVTNNLRIDTWKELPQHSAEFWVPASLASVPQVPLIWTARGATGAVYDVPDNFGTTIGGMVSIDDNFAFISPVTVQNMDWVYDIDGVGGADPEPRQIGAVPKPTRVGWGGFARQETINGPFTFYTSNINGSGNPIDTDEFGNPIAYDERTMLRLPVEPSTGTVSNALLVSLEATVVVTSWEENFSPVITSVPEPSAFLGIALIGFASGVGVWIRKKATSAQCG